ncbi:hypothetical protein ACLBWP_11835 [Microbacterium sp. M1A1_1b]
MTETIEAPPAGGRRPDRRPGAKRGSAAPAQRAIRDAAQRAKGGKDRQSLVIGGAPRADLLPTEVHVHRRQRAAVRRAWAGVVIVAVAVGIGAVAGGLAKSSEDTRLAAAQAETVSLLQQQRQFSDVRAAEADTSLLQAAQQVGGSTEIDWSQMLGSVQSKLPSGVRISGVTIDSASATTAYVQSIDPLQGQRIATLTIDAKTAELPSVPAWLDSVHSVTGFVDATANSVTRDDTTGDYTVNLTIHLDEKALDGRFAADAQNKD